MTQNELNKILENHKHWINRDCEDWENMKANLSDADFSDANLRGADLRNADLTYTEFGTATKMNTKFE